MPGEGDALRRLAPHKDGVPLWWKVTNRNKKGITLDLRKADGKALLGRLVAEHDVLVENFRTGTLDEWGITRALAAGDQPEARPSCASPASARPGPIATIPASPACSRR